MIRKRAKEKVNKKLIERTYKKRKLLFRETHISDRRLKNEEFSQEI